jgi:peptidoglycan/LPS O-acetylase OafA/YrhL
MASAVRLLSLTGLRFFLAFWVIIFHQSFSWWGHGAFGRGYLVDAAPGIPVSAQPFIGAGFIAVSIFFILSGFVLSYNYSLSESWRFEQFMRYMVARLARIYPVYVLGLFLMAPFVLYPAIKWHWIDGVKGSIEDLLLNLGLLQAWHPYLATSWNFPAWSLSDEAFFYCCFPWIGLLIWRMSISRGVAAIFLLWVLAMAAPVAATSISLSGVTYASVAEPHLDSNPFWSMFVQYDPLLRLPDFCIGIVLGRVYNLLVRRKSRLLGRGYWLYLAGFVLEGFAIAYGKTLPHLWLMNGLFTPFHSLVILGLAFGGGPLAKMLSSRPLVFLGNASYAMFILHAPVFLYLNYFAYRFFHRVKLGGVPDLVLYLSLVCLVSAIINQYFEEPVNRFLRSRFIWRSASNQATESNTIRAEGAPQRSA